MDQVNDGGPAFPTPRYERGDMYSLGMTLRDYFAAKAMKSLLDDAWAQPKDWQMRNLGKIGPTAYAIADAMLKAREQTNE